MMQGCNFVNDQCDERGASVAVHSVIDAEQIAEVPLLAEADLMAAAERLQGPVPSTQEALEFFARLHTAMNARKDDLRAVLHEESGFAQADNDETVPAILDFLTRFADYAARCQRDEGGLMPHDLSDPKGRSIRLVRKAIPCVAVMVPQNASLILAVVAMCVAMYSGARVIIRPSTACGASGSLFARCVAESDPPAGCLAVTHCRATDFLATCMQTRHIGLVHYIGSDRFALDVLSQCFRSGKEALIDGEGNGQLFLGPDVDVDEAATLISDAVLRYNGQTCTSVNGVVADPAIASLLEAALQARFEAITVGDPRDATVQLGPVYSAGQAQGMCERARQSQQATVLCGGQCDGALLSPTLIRGPSLTDDMVRLGFFGPLVWLASAPFDEWSHWLAANRFPLSDTLLGHDPAQHAWLINHSRAGRLCFNTDPSIESMFEPWGGYAPAASNPVSHWLEKYTIPVQLDAQAEALDGYAAQYRAATLTGRR